MPIVICICLGVCICTYIIYKIHVKEEFNHSISKLKPDSLGMIYIYISPVDVRGMEGPGHEVQKKVGM